MSKSSADKYKEELIAYLEGYPKNNTKEAVAFTKNGTLLFGVINDANRAAEACLWALRDGDVGKIAATYTKFMEAHRILDSQIQRSD